MIKTGTSLPNLLVPVVKIDLSSAQSVDVSLNPKNNKVKKVSVSGNKLKKKEYTTSMSENAVIIIGQGNYSGTFVKNI